MVGFLCVVCDFPVHPINWSLATVKGSSPRERAYFHPAYSEVASSPCDLTENFCDVSCCSDQDCSKDQKSSFTCSIKKQNTDMGNITEEETLPVSFSGNPGYEVSRPLVVVMNNSLENDTSTVWKQGMVGIWSKGGICMIRPESLPESYSVHHTAVPFIIPSGVIDDFVVAIDVSFFVTVVEDVEALEDSRELFVVSSLVIMSVVFAKGVGCVFKAVVADWVSSVNALSFELDCSSVVIQGQQEEDLHDEDETYPFFLNGMGGTILNDESVSQGTVEKEKKIKIKFIDNFILLMWENHIWPELVHIWARYTQIWGKSGQFHFWARSGIFPDGSVTPLDKNYMEKYFWCYVLSYKLHGVSPQASYTDRAAAAVSDGDANICG
uniref:(California timema) hypothetical protein n=1 Tax=Timema californicum TaxID=61474 RepID=A0A7R9J0S8_TIMCA|nr:unnamed protein product [Timema californicum]